jgi:hypothetical protein
MQTKVLLLFQLNSSYRNVNPRTGKGFSVVYCRIYHAKLIHGRKYVQDLFYITLVISYSIKKKLQVFCNLIKLCTEFIISFVTV